MAFRIGDLVVCGEIFNTRNYSVHGWLELRGQEQPVLLQLTGNCDPDLAGWHIRFEVRSPQDQGDPAESDTDQVDLSSLAWQQVGPTGTMTAARKVRVADCPPTELYIRSQLDEPPPMEWKRCLYLEWFSQNGRVVVELVDPIVEFVEFTEIKGVSATDSTQTQSGDDDADSPTGGLGITSIRIDDDGQVEIRDETLAGGQEEETDEECDEGYGLIPDELQQQFDAQAAETDRAVENDQDKSDVIREMELMDELIERGEGEPVGTIFDTPVKLPPPDQLDDDQAEPALKSLLAQLALYGIALDICEHFTPRDAYRLLLEEICTKQKAYPELRQTQWVQHFMTSEFCEQCEAEMDREFEEDQRHRQESPPDDAPTDENDPGEEAPQ